jgi:hypothetical protein
MRTMPKTRMLATPRIVRVAFLLSFLLSFISLAVYKFQLNKAEEEMSILRGQGLAKAKVVEEARGLKAEEGTRTAILKDQRLAEARLKVMEAEGTGTAEEGRGKKAEDSVKAKTQQEEKIQDENCTCTLPTTWTAQAGQDHYLFERVFSQQSLCCKGIFVEFGARNGIDHSNTYSFEKFMGWKGLLFEVDPREYPNLRRNRNHSHVMSGPVCPSTMNNVTIALSGVGGWTGAESSIGMFLLCFSIAC